MLPVTTATFLAPGTYALRLTADDGALTSSATVGIVVTDAAPALAAVSDRVITLGTRFRLQLQGRDTNVDDTLRYAIVGGPGGALIDAEGLVDWTPTAAQLGRHTFTVSVTDAAGHVATTSFGVEVVKLNQAPTLDAQADVTLSPGASFTRTLHATDPDAGDVLTYALVSGPSGMTLAGSTLAWTVPGSSAGTYVVKVRVRDAEGLSDVKQFTITVQPATTPVARDDAYEVPVGATLRVPAAGVLANDLATGGSIAAVKLSEPDKGTLAAFDADGSFTFVAPAGRGRTAVAAAARAVGSVGARRHGLRLRGRHQPRRGRRHRRRDLRRADRLRRQDGCQAVAGLGHVGVLARPELRDVSLGHRLRDGRRRRVRRHHADRRRAVRCRGHGRRLRRG